jgi:hypothetical protein
VTTAAVVVPAASRRARAQAVVRLPQEGVQDAQAGRGALVVGQDVLGRGPGQREQQEADQARAVAAGHAVHEHPARGRLRDLPQHAGAPLRPAFQERAQGERGAAVLVGLAGLVQGHVHDGHLLGAVAGARAVLARGAQVDDRPYAVRRRGRPARRGQPVGGVGTHDGAPAGAPAGGGR